MPTHTNHTLDRRTSMMPTPSVFRCPLRRQCLIGTPIRRPVSERKQMSNALDLPPDHPEPGGIHLIVSRGFVVRGLRCPSCYVVVTAHRFLVWSIHAAVWLPPLLQ